MKLLEIKNLKTFYETRKGTIKAVDGVNLTLEKREVIGLVGESGCGKTTTGMSIMRMIETPGRIVEGEIHYRNLFEVIQKNGNKKYKNIKSTNLLDLEEKEMRKIRGNKISMIFQGAMNALNPVHRVGNQILEMIQIHDPEIEPREAWDKVLDILEVVGIEKERARDYPHQLSGGMKQRALIAMALVNNPDIVIADEPVTALDVIVQAQVLKATKKLQKQFNLSMIMITHDLSVIAEVCDTVAVMYAGSIVEYGHLRDVFKEPLHPYTQALINAFPSIVGEKKELYDIGGAPPDLRNPPSGCRFHPRCPKAMPICSKEKPLETTKKAGFVACHLYQEG